MAARWKKGFKEFNAMQNEMQEIFDKKYRPQGTRFQGV
jgi:hypothetical protein